MKHCINNFINTIIDRVQNVVTIIINGIFSGRYLLEEIFTYIRRLFFGVVY